MIPAINYTPGALALFAVLLVTVVVIALLAGTAARSIPFAAFYSALRCPSRKECLIPDFTDSIAEIKREGEVFGPRNRAAGEEFENHLRDMQADMEAELEDQGKRPTAFVRKLKAAK